MDAKFLAVSADGFARMYGQGERGQGHAILIPALSQGDPVGASGARIVRACGGTLPAERAAEKFAGEKQCPKCVAFLATAEGAALLDTSRAERHAWEYGTDDMRELAAAVAESDTPREITPGEVAEIVKASSRANKRRRRAVAVEAERDRLAARKAERAEIAQMAAGPERDRAVRDVWESATLPGSEIVASTGKTLAQMSEETAAFYANGGKVSDEIAKLPAPGTANVAHGTVSGGSAEILKCEFSGPVEKLNLEKTHGKCPACTAYIPLLPERERKESGPRVGKSACGHVGEAPESGTRVMRDDHTVKVADDYQGKTSAPCPGCTRVIAVSREGVMRRHNGLILVPAGPVCGPDKIGTHNVGGVATPGIPAGKRLTSRSIDTVEHGSTPGDTSDASARRVDESRCERSGKILAGAKGGKVTCPGCARENIELIRVVRKDKNGDDKISWKIPNHVRAGESVKHTARGDVRDVTPRGEGSDVGTVRGTGHGKETAVKGARLALSRGHGSVDGVANTGRQNMRPVQPKGWVGTAGTGVLPATVRPGVDRCVTGDICPLPECEGQRKEVAHAGKSSSWRRRHNAKVGAWHAGRDAERKAERAAKIESGEILATAERKALRKAASVGSFSEGNVSGTVTHEPRPEFKAKGERKPAPNRKGGSKHTVRDGKAE